MKKYLILYLFLINFGLIFGQFLRPQIVFYEDGYDFGTIKEGTVVDHIFNFVNMGGDTLKIMNISTSCGCTAGILSKNNLLPGEKGSIKVSFDSRGRSGQQMKLIYIKTNDPELTDKSIMIKANVVKDMPNPENMKAPRIQFTTREHNFGKVVGEKVYETVFVFKNVGKDVLEIKDIKTSCGCTAAVTSKTKLKPNETGELKVELDTSGRSGMMSRTVSVFSNDPENPTTTLVLTCEIITK